MAVIASNSTPPKIRVGAAREQTRHDTPAVQLSAGQTRKDQNPAVDPRKTVRAIILGISARGDRTMAKVFARKRRSPPGCCQAAT